MCQRATGTLTFCEMVGQCYSEEAAACGRFGCGNVLLYRLKVVRYLCFFWLSKLNIKFIREREIP